LLPVSATRLVSGYAVVYGIQKVAILTLACNEQIVKLSTEHYLNVGSDPLGLVYPATRHNNG